MGLLCILNGSFYVKFNFEFEKQASLDFEHLVVWDTSQATGVIAVEISYIIVSRLLQLFL